MADPAFRTTNITSNPNGGTASATVLVVDDEASVREVLRGFLEMAGLRVLEAANSQEMFALIDRQPVDLVTLDVGLGAENGLDLARELRERASCGIIMVSGRGDLIDRVVGLEVGADDYIAKPFELREVLARVRSVLRRVQPAGTRTAGASAGTMSGSLAFDRFTLYPTRRELRNGHDDVCELTTAEYNLLELFVSRPNQVLSRDQIMDHLHGHDWSPTDRSIDNGVARLRRKLESSDTQDIIKTVRGAGYLFTATVTRC